MKMMIIATFLLINSTFAAIKTYDLKMNVSLDGKSISNSKILAEEDKTTTITSADANNFIEVIPTKYQDKVLMKFTVGKIENGERKIICTPEIIVKENDPVTMTMQDNDNVSKQLSISVTPATL